VADGLDKARGQILRTEGIDEKVHVYAALCGARQSRCNAPPRRVFFKYVGLEMNLALSAIACAFKRGKKLLSVA
jgi:hypothetical protein